MHNIVWFVLDIDEFTQLRIRKIANDFVTMPPSYCQTVTMDPFVSPRFEAPERELVNSFKKYWITWLGNI